jgi:hypothetical protein
MVGERAKRGRMVNEIEKGNSGGKRLSEGELLDEIGRRTAGLFYISETDAEITPFSGGRVGNVTAAGLLRILDLPPETQIESRNFDDFFEGLTRERDWHTEADRHRIHMFRLLQASLKENLEDRHVFRIGTTRVEIFAVGRDPEGNLVGIKTMAVET